MEELNFVWDMDEEDWELMMKEHRLTRDKQIKRADKTPETYGYCFVGYLRADIMHTLNPRDCEAFSDVYAIGVYRCCCGKYRNKTYSLLSDAPKVVLLSRSFKQFKKNFEARFKEFIMEDPERIELANKPLGWR